MSGNGRWVKKQGRIRAFRHKAGAKSVRQAISLVANSGIDALTLYVFSSESWSRPAQEVSALTELLVQASDSEVRNLHHHNVHSRIIGDINRFNSHSQERIRKSEAITAQNTRLTLNVAANRGEWRDIVQGVRQLAQQVQDGILHPEQIDEKMFGQQICMHELTPMDSVIRTGREHRISSFPLWQIAYAGLYLTDALWPDFDKQDFEGALHIFANRKRRFGSTKSGDEEV